VAEGRALKSFVFTKRCVSDALSVSLVTLSARASTFRKADLLSACDEKKNRNDPEELPTHEPLFPPPMDMPQIDAFENRIFKTGRESVKRFGLAYRQVANLIHFMAGSLLLPISTVFLLTVS